jgi:hypothetical protein
MFAHGIELCLSAFALETYRMLMLGWGAASRSGHPESKQATGNIAIRVGEWIMVTVYM